MFFYNHNPIRPEQVSYRLRRDVARQEIEITPLIFLGDPGSVECLEGERFLFRPRDVLANHNLAPYWTSHACWGLESRHDPAVLGYLHPVYPLTEGHKGPHPLILPVFERPILFYVPFPDSSVHEIAVLCYVHPNRRVEGNPEPVRVRSRSEIERQVLPGIRLSGSAHCSADAAISINIELIDAETGACIERDEIIHLESDAGYLNRRKVLLRAGRGTVQWTALALSAGETAEVKVGFKYFPAKALHRINVG